MGKYSVVNPATGETVKEYPQISDEDLSAAIAAATEAHRNWAVKTSVSERAALVKKVAELHSERRETLAEIIVREMGKPMEQALGEVDFCVDIYGYYADNAEEFLADEPIKLLAGDGTALVRKTSVGPLLGIMPWNFPYYQVARFAGPNLVLGNTILLKPAHQCPESAEAIQTMMTDAGFPDGAYQTILASNEQIAEVIADPRSPGRLADRLRAGRSRSRRDRRAQPEKGGARARRLRSVRPAGSGRPRRSGRCRSRRPPRQHWPVLQRGEAVHRRRRSLRRVPREVHGQDGGHRAG
jgi:hypothetical protein